jgi:hypothetical protein
MSGRAEIGYGWPMRMDEARAALSEAFTTQILQAFETSRRRGSAATYSRLRRFSQPGLHVGHNADLVPEVPAAVVHIRRDAEEPGVTFTWKVETGQAPHPMLRVTRGWLREVVRPGHVVLDGFPVLDVIERDDGGRPVVVTVAAVAGYFDSAMHGWRSHAEALQADVDWTDEATPAVILARATAQPA